MVKRLYNPPRTTPREEKHRDTEKQTLQLSRHSDHVLWIFFFFVSLMCAHPLSCIRRRCCGCMCRPCHLVAPTGSANAMVRVTSRQFALHLLFLFLEKKKSMISSLAASSTYGLTPSCLFFFLLLLLLLGFFFFSENKLFLWLYLTALNCCCPGCFYYYYHDYNFTFEVWVWGGAMGAMSKTLKEAVKQPPRWNISILSYLKITGVRFSFFFFFF